jgi:hypothetical protein
LTTERDINNLFSISHASTVLSLKYPIPVAVL